MDLKAVGLRIKTAREAKGLTQENLAALVDLSSTHISCHRTRYENCKIRYVRCHRKCFGCLRRYSSGRCCNTFSGWTNERPAGSNPYSSTR